MTSGKYFNRAVMALDSPHIGHVVVETDDKIVVFGGGKERQRLTKLAQWVDQNNIKVNIDKTFPLDEAGKALDYQNGVHPRGKVVLTV
jgi:NADPH:quinone reductase-like Zn-dependent oxidoreductase